MGEDEEREQDSGGPNLYWGTRTVPFMVCVWCLGLALLIPAAWGMLVYGLPTLLSQRGLDIPLYGAVAALAVFAWWLGFETLRYYTRLWRRYRDFFRSDAKRKRKR